MPVAADAWVSPLGPSGPTADGEPLILEVSCRTSRLGRGRSHSVSISADWEVTTPHDLESERIAAAFGGYLSCLELVDTIVPAVRHLTQLRTRRRLPSITSAGTVDTWRLATPAAACICSQRTYRSIPEAAEHERGSAHWVRSTAAPERQLSRFLSEVEDRHPDDARPRTTDRVRRMVDDLDGFRELWARGIPPEFVEQVHHAVWPDGGALPRRVYELVAFNGADLAWLREVREAVGDVDAVAWAARTEHIWGQHPRTTRLSWLSTGAPRSAIEALLPSGYSLSDVADTAKVFDFSKARAVSRLAGWVAVGCSPTMEQLAALARVPFDHFVPNAASIQALRNRAARVSGTPTYDEAAMVLAAAGTQSSALELLRAGVRTAEEAVAALHGDLSRSSNESVNNRKESA